MLKQFQKLVKCPFDSEHLIVEDRLQRHVLKCMKKYPNHVKCPYNSLHCFMNKNDLVQHILECPNKGPSRSWNYLDNQPAQRCVDNVPVHIDVPKSGVEENWEDEYR